MKKYWITIMMTVLAIAAISGIACTASADTSGPSTVNVSESGKQITLSPGDSLIVTLDSNATTGFSWSVAGISDEDVVDEVSNEYQGSDSGMIGAGGQEVWTFETLDEGTSTIEMQYSRSWETGVEPAATFNVTVIVK
ncbi:MAG: protease inhibitor I42 family protein [Dehalococcoidia bacterium]